MSEHQTETTLTSMPAVTQTREEVVATATVPAVESSGDGATSPAPHRVGLPWRLAALALGGLLAAGVGLADRAIPSDRAQQQAVSVAAAGVYVCPAADANLAQASVSLTAGGDGVTAQSLSGGSSRRAVPALERTLLDKPTDAVRLDGTAGARAGGMSVAADTATHKGLGAVPCSTPRTETWLTGVMSNGRQVAEVNLTNVDPSEADVDLAFYGPSGIIVAQGSRSIVVRPGTSVKVSLEPLVKVEGPITVRVRTSQGRVQATARQRLLDDAKTATVGADWISPAAEPATTLLVPGIPGGEGARNLLLANPGKKVAKAKVEVIRANGTTTLVEGENVPVQAESTLSVALESALKGEAVALRITSDAPLTAAVSGRSGKANGDLVVVPAAPAFGGHALVALPTGTQAKLSLSNPTGAAASVKLLGKGDDRTVDVPAGSTKVVDLSDAQPVVQIEGPRDVVGAVMLTRDLGGLPGAAVVPLQPADAPRTDVTPAEDPAVGR